MSWLRKMLTMQKTKFAVQKETLWGTLRHPKLRRCCIDATGIGMQMAEETQDEFGKYRIEPVTFTNAVKEDLAYGLRRKFEDRAIRIPPDFNLRESLHSVKKITTAAGNIRFDAVRSDSGHADEFWALALAEHGISPDNGPVSAASASGRGESRNMRGYDAEETSRFVRDVRDRKRRGNRYAGY
jgi:phage FluMu gp28-like protein